MYTASRYSAPTHCMDLLICVSLRLALPPHLYESVAGSVVSDGEAQSILRLEHFHFLLDPFDVSKDKILQANLPPQQLLHVNLVGVQGAEQDLHTNMQANRLHTCNT